MADRLNQHWVPQYYFRFFSNGTSHIHLLLKSQERLVLNAPIRGQCARRKFYGPAKFESALATLESTDAAVIRRVITHAWNPEAAMQHEDHRLICRACVFQRARTSLEANKDGPALESFSLYAFRHYLATAPGIDDRERMLAAIDSGQVKVKAARQYVVALAMSKALRSAPLLLDLGLRLLRNRSDFPFIFGDAPVIFANPSLAKIHSRGVLGLTSPGLIVLWPLDSRTMLLLLDEAAYEGEVIEGEVIDVVNRGDVSQLNALQLHHSEGVVYFGSSDAAPYVERLWNAHKSKIVRPRIEFHERSDWLLDGEPTETPIMHMFEPQLNLSPALTILRPRFYPKEPYQFRRRNPEFFAAVQEMLEREPGGTDD